VLPSRFLPGERTRHARHGRALPAVLCPNRKHFGEAPK
jgi:hypothetical protein